MSIILSASCSFDFSSWCQLHQSLSRPPDAEGHSAVGSEEVVGEDGLLEVVGEGDVGPPGLPAAPAHRDRHLVSFPFASLLWNDSCFFFPGGSFPRGCCCYHLSADPGSSARMLLPPPDPLVLPRRMGSVLWSHWRRKWQRERITRGIWSQRSRQGRGRRDV